MIRVGILWFAAVGIPLRGSRPGFAAVLRQVQIHSPTKDPVGIGRMYDDAVAIGHLTFLGELASSNGLPSGPLIRASEDSQNTVGRGGGDRVHGIRAGRRDSDAGARHMRWIR